MGKKSSYVHSMILIILMYCLVSCAPTSSTGKTPEFYYKDSKIIKLCKAISRNDEQAVVMPPVCQGRHYVEAVKK